jgi:methyl-accepting chemotaxis protein
VIQDVEGYVEQLGQAANARAADMQAMTQMGISATMIAAVVALLVGLSAAIFSTLMIVRPLKNVVVQMDNADLQTELMTNRSDEIGDLLRAFDKFVSTIRSSLLEVRDVSTAVASASSEISCSTEQMASGANEQTTQTGEVASAVEEMTKTIIENSRNANETVVVARDARKAAQEGGDVVRSTIAAMKEIEHVVKNSATTIHKLGKSSSQIGEIISVIDDIADQTNLLALNAAIEAARAGEQGRGFAVVADEVRKLAERTTKATKEIADMITRIQHETNGAVQSMEAGTKKVDDGIQLADEAGKSLNDLVAISQRVTDMVTQIAAASEQQSSASEQISRNVEAINAVTSVSAAGTQQIARAAEDLNHLTEQLQTSVGRFKLANESRDHSFGSGKIPKRATRRKSAVTFAGEEIGEDAAVEEHHSY